MASVYVHFPWCLAKCPYCDFVSYATDRGAIDHAGSAAAVIRELERRAGAAGASRDGASPATISSVFFGGGTPSLWGPEGLGRVLARIRALFPTSEGAELEVTVECNPTSLDRDRAAALVEAGVGRLSIGTQSLRQDQLSFLGRLHDPDGALRAIDAALAAGVPRVSTDLIFGIADQSPEDAASQASRLAATGLRHLSCYQLTIEPGTQFGERKKRGLLPMADDALVADGFLAVEAALEARGFAHYEISNYAFPGEEARHNLAYWRGDDYLGVGVAAFGFTRKGARGVRWRNEIDPRKYVESTRTREPTIFTEELDGEALLRERIMLGLRVKEGVDLARAARELGVAPWTADRTKNADRLVARGRLARDGDVLSIPRAAWLFTDDTASRLF